MPKDYLHIRLESGHFDANSVEIHTIEGLETIGQLFFFDLEIVCLHPESLNPDDMPGALVTLVFEKGEQEVRRMYGLISEVCDLLDTEDSFDVYRLRIVPRLWRLTLTSTTHIFMDQSIPDIIKKKLEPIGLTEDGKDFELRLMESYPKREFVMQYHETDLNFVSRLCEHLGISFFFEHDGDRDKVVFTDKDGFHPIQGDDSVPYMGRGDQVGVFEIESVKRLITNICIERDYNYRTPQLDLEEPEQLTKGYGGGHFEYGSHFKTPFEAKQMAQIRAQAEQSTHSTFRGRSSWQTFSAGATFKIAGHPRDIPRLLLKEVRHRASQTVAGRGSGDERTYLNEWRACRCDDVPYRPPRITPAPRIYGAITGIVEPGPDGGIGKFAQLDEQGRYIIQFMWDADPSERSSASRRIRMIQPHAGPNYGIHFPLRPGIEVLIIFVDGDPDRPLIVGAVPNPITPSPVDSSNSTKNRIKTESGMLLEFDDGAGS